MYIITNITEAKQWVRTMKINSMKGNTVTLNCRAQCCISDREILQQVQVWIKHRYVAGTKNIQYNLTREDIVLSHF